MGQRTEKSGASMICITKDGTTGGDIHIPTSGGASIHAKENRREPTHARDRKKRKRIWSDPL